MGHSWENVPQIKVKWIIFFPSQIMHLKRIHFLKVLLLYSLLHSFFVKYSPSLSPHPTVLTAFVFFLIIILFLHYVAFTIIHSVIHSWLCHLFSQHFISLNFFQELLTLYKLWTALQAICTPSFWAFPLSLPRSSVLMSLLPTPAASSSWV